MSNYITKVNTELFSGLFRQEVNFTDGLNIISGTNGTGKTQFLNWIFSQKNNPAYISFSDNSQRKEIIVFSPKRNAEKVLAENFQSQFGYDKSKQTQAIQQFFSQQLQDTNIQSIRAIVHYLVESAELLVNSNQYKKVDASNTIKEEYQKVLSQIFDYQLDFSWNVTNSRYEAKIIKNGNNVSLDTISAGENAIISLVFAIYFTRDFADVYLIDEPEVHLNWSLEEKLFTFLESFCKTYNKQIITVTHSRIIALEKYAKKTQFLTWENSVVAVKTSFTPEMIKDITGDTVRIIQGVTAKQKLIYVEDEAHKCVLDYIKSKMNLDCDIQVHGSSETVKQLSNAFKALPVDNVYFLIDGDNKPLTDADKTKYKNLIQLEKYCIENYLLNNEVLTLYNNTQNWSDKLVTAIKSMDVKSKPHIKPVQLSLDKGVNVFEIIDTIDGSELISMLSKDVYGNDKSKRYDYIKDILNKIPDAELLDKYFMELNFMK